MEPQSALYKFIISQELAYEGLVTKEISGQQEGGYGRNVLLERNFFSPHYGITDLCQYHTTVVDRLNKYMQATKMESEVSSSPAFQSYVNAQAESVKREMQTQDESIVHVGAAVSQSVPSSPTSVPGVISNQNAGRQLESNNSHSCATKGQSGERTVNEGQFPFTVNTGQLGHPLNVVSAYRHRIERLGSRVSEVTTHHNRGKCTVDYIFYTVDSKETRVEWDQVRVRKIRDGKLKLLGRYGLMSADELNRLGGIPSAAQPSDHLCLIARFLLQ
jgi:hypothetical protein